MKIESRSLVSRFRINNADAPYDVVVVGAGHAGCEAALAAARMGAEVLLLSGNLDTIAQMSCNPAIGGQAKGHIVREIDALGGEMARNADLTAIQFRLLNASKGPSTQAPRAQCDKKHYQFRMKQILERTPSISLFQAVAVALITERRDGRNTVVGVRSNMGVEFHARTVVLTTGTFLRGLMHVGHEKSEGGRMGDFSAKDLSQTLVANGLELGRLKTGTPPRILGRSIDFAHCAEQKGDPRPTLFAFWDTHDAPPVAPECLSKNGGALDADELFHVEQLSCWLTDTTGRTRQIIRDNLHRSPLYSGEIKGTGPRYCPSIEDKVVRFAHKETHRLFLEPEGRETDEWYINGLSSSLPLDAQVEILRSVPGLENAVMTRPAYAVEYDFVPPTQLYPTFETKPVANLFLAGQINGTSGYEEAAGQGLVAGANAVAKLRGLEPIVLGRHESYIGVLADDLVTKGTAEPYRMFTSRAEYRLLLNHGSAELRLWRQAARLGLVSATRLARIERKVAEVERWRVDLESIRIRGGVAGDVLRKLAAQADALHAGTDAAKAAGDADFAGAAGQGSGAPAAGGGVVPDLPVPDDLPAEFRGLPRSVRDEVLYRVCYRGYLERDLRAIERQFAWESKAIPDSLDYERVSGLRLEARQKLKAVLPRTLAHASRISGVSPADVCVLEVALRALAISQSSGSR
ncbi:MAG: tRNA uridine-5-carboxymethylaminomethyl(34) synthesis enzyme MnmG [Puniceicoccales bacterium]|nr:tRNA uridine-5-carboxymethylaminomethyl(34) synthesis enzyme MnmG [Puniceicoccales bacterium]